MTHAVRRVSWQSRLVWLLVAIGVQVGPVAAQGHIPLRPGANAFRSVLLQRGTVDSPSGPMNAIQALPSKTGRGAVVGGAVGLLLSSLAVVLYVESTDAGNYSGPVIPIVVAATAVGAVVGAAVGAGRESPSHSALRPRAET